MEFNIRKSKLYHSIKFRQGSLYAFSVFVTPILLVLVPLLFTASIYFNLLVIYSIFGLFSAFLMPILFFRLAFSDELPQLDIKQYIASNGTKDISLAMSCSAVRIMQISDICAKKHRSKLSPFWLIEAFSLDPEGRELLLRIGMNINLSNFSESFEDADTDNWKNLFTSAIKFAEENNGIYIEIEDLMVGLVKTNKAFERLVNFFELDAENVSNVALWHKRLREYRKKLPFWLKPVISPLGQDWAFGYARILNRLGSNLTRISLFSPDISIFNKKPLLESVERILARSAKNNVLLVGENGVGKKMIVNALAQKISKDDTHPNLKYKQIIQINAGSLIAGTRGQGDVVQRVEMMMNEAAYNGDIILLLENIHALISSSNDEGAINASEILLPHLSGDRVQVIGTTTLDKYHQDIEASPAIVDAFERIDVPESNSDEALQILEDNIPALEYRYGVFFTLPVLQEIVKLADRFLHDKYFPQKAIDLADEVSVKVSAEKNILIRKKDVQDIISGRTHVPVGEVAEAEKDKLLNLETILHQKIIGQNEAITAVSNALRRARSGLAGKNRPIGSFLFVGPTGVGKTETTKALSEIYFGSESKMIRFDMSEYQDPTSVYRLIGTPPSPGAPSQSGILTTAVHDNPFSLILLDELEKAHSSVQTLFLQVLDDGRLTDSEGKTIDFKNSIIIATSNAGSEMIRQYLKSGAQDVAKLKEILLDYLQKNGIYKPEFLNRFDAVVAFKPLLKEEIGLIANLMIGDINKNLEEKGVSVAVNPDGIDYLVQKGYDAVFGARPMRRLLQEKIENILARRLLLEKFPHGTVINLSLQELENA